ncbi:MAG: DinB family protein [Candidatus Thorarchaeota archaeon]|nr:DinB family protein [Candidatus Thorarchaeota archaeon]
MSEESEQVVALDRSNELAPRVALFYSMMERVRGNLIRRVETLSDRTIDYTPEPKMIESIGTLLLHIAAIEYSWIFEDIGGQEMEYEKWKYGFSVREGIDQIEGKDIEFYLSKLREVRQEVSAFLKTFEDKDLDSIIEVDGEKVSVEWILFHLIEHEAMHIGQVSFLLRLGSAHKAQKTE